jgi:hypothetical protein
LLKLRDLAATSDAGAQQPPIRAGERGYRPWLLSLTIEPVSNLDQGDSRPDEGKDQQTIPLCPDRNQPVVAGFLVDRSNSTRIHWKNFRDAAIEMALNLLPAIKSTADT